MLFTNTKKNSKKREIKLSRHDEESMVFDDNYYFQAGKFHYTIGLVPETRMRKLIGKKDVYYILKYNHNEVKCIEKTHDLTTAQFELSWALNSDTYTKMFAEMRSAMKENGNKKTMDKKVNTNTTEKTLTELGILSGIVAGAIDTTDLDKSDIDQFINLETKRVMKRAKKDKPRVIVIPDTLPEMHTEWNY
jgi:phosphotransacetylase